MGSLRPSKRWDGANTGVTPVTGWGLFFTNPLRRKGILAGLGLGLGLGLGVGTVPDHVVQDDSECAE
jgi:hypothetical protein